MRIGQLARKYDVPVQDIIGFLEKETGETFHPNAKLYDLLETKVFDHFELHVLSEEAEQIEAPLAQAQEQPLVDANNDTEVDTLPETPSEISPMPAIDEADEATLLPATPEEEIAAVEGELILPGEREKVKEQKEPVAEAEPPQTMVSLSDDEVIQTDKLLELVESEDTAADLEKIKLIKAPKRELSGLKVLGKVELPEPKKKTSESDKETRDRRNKKSQLSEAEKEKRRLKAKRKKEAYEARKEKREKEQEIKRKKAIKEAHYKSNILVAEAKKQKQKEKNTVSEVSPKKKTKPTPKTWIGKWWRWMNT